LFLNDLKVALRSLARSKDWRSPVVLTLALASAQRRHFQCGARRVAAALVNRDENRLITSARARAASAPKTRRSPCRKSGPAHAHQTVTTFGDFSTIGFTMVGLGEPREVRRALSADRISR